MLQSKGVLAGTTVKSVGALNSLTVTQSYNVTNLAVDKDKIHDSLTAGMLPPLTEQSQF